MREPDTGSICNTMPTRLFFSLSFFIIFYYLELISQYWFVSLLGGYQIRVWVPVLVIFLVLIYKKFSERKFEWNKNYVILTVYCITAFMAMFLKEATFHQVVKYFLVMAAPAWMYFIISELFRNNRDIVKFVHIMFFACIVFGVGTYVYNLICVKSPALAERTVVTHFGNTISQAQAYFTVNGTHTYSRGVLPVEHGKYCGILAPAVIFGILQFFCGKGRRRYVYFSGGLLLGYICFNTLSRTGIVTIFAGFVALGWCLYVFEKALRLKIILYCLMILSIALIYIVMWQHNIFLRLLQLMNIFNISWINQYLYDNSLLACNSGNFLDPHITSIFVSWNNFLKHPFFGMGYSSIADSSSEHNRYMFILTSSGIFVFLSYCYFLVSNIKDSLRTAFAVRGSDDSHRYYAYFFLSCSIMFLFKLVNEGMETFFYWIIFALAFAWARNIARVNVTKG